MGNDGDCKLTITENVGNPSARDVIDRFTALPILNAKQICGASDAQPCLVAHSVSIDLSAAPMYGRIEHRFSAKRSAQPPPLSQKCAVYYRSMFR